MKRVLSVVVVFLFFVGGCSSSEHLLERENAVKIEGAYKNGTMSASVGPLYRLESGATVLALTGKFSSDITNYPAEPEVGQAIVTPQHVIRHAAYSGLFLLDDSEVFVPLTGEDDQVLWLPQDQALNKDQMHPHADEEKKNGLSESVLIPFGEVGDVDRVGVSVGLIGFAGDVPVVPMSDAPKDIQSVVAKMEPTLNLDKSIHSPYSQLIEAPGIHLDSSAESLHVKLVSDDLFDAGSWELKPESTKVLDQLVLGLESREPGEVEIIGHTDGVPDPNVGNQVLSENRAVAVKAALEQRSELAGFSFIASGKGDTEPVTLSDRDWSREENRRVSIVAKSPVKKDLLNDGSSYGQLPDPYSFLSQWPDFVEYKSPDWSRWRKPEMNIRASKAIAYPNYTVVTYTVTSKHVEGDWDRDLLMDKPNLREIMESIDGPTFLGADIVRGQSRALPLKFISPNNYGRLSPWFLTGGGTQGMVDVQQGDQITIPVIYPPTTDETITVDVSNIGESVGNNTGWRIRGIPVVQATNKDLAQDDK